MKNKVAIYARESTDKQDLEKLVEMCVTEANKLGYDNYELYKDVGSGTSNTRKMYLELIKDIKSNKVKILILYESSRITRDTLEHQIFFRILQEYGVKLYILNRGWVDPNDENDEFTSALFNLLDAKEVKRLRARVKDAMAHIKNSGRWTGGDPPLGYSLIDKKLHVNDDAVIVKEIFELFLTGENRSKIAKMFNLNLKKVVRILKNPIYIGKLKKNEITTVNRKKVYNKVYEVVEGIHQPIISEIDFRNVQNILKTIIRETTSVECCFKDILKCYCGEKLYPKKPDIYHKKFYYYCNCGSKIIKEDELLESVLIALKDVILSLDLIQESTDISDFSSQTNFYKRELNKIPAKEEKLITRLIDGSISDSLYENQLIRLNELKEEYKEKISKLENIRQSELGRENTVDLLKNYFHKISEEKNPKELNIFFKLIIDKIEFINSHRFQLHLKI
ncbi:MAG: recombinase family protein [Fusobacteriaceae bacterium]